MTIDQVEERLKELQEESGPELDGTEATVNEAEAMVNAIRETLQSSRTRLRDATAVLRQNGYPV